MHAITILKAAWRDPVAVLAAFAEEPWAIGFLSGGSQARWSYVARRPEETLVTPGASIADPFAALAELLGPAIASDPRGPPFQGGVAGLAAYSLAETVEPLGLARLEGWPDLACARYPAILAFDHETREVLAVGRGVGEARRALTWLDLPAVNGRRPSADIEPDDPGAYEAAVAEVVARIAAGEIFQANIARRWMGRLASGVTPFDLMAEIVRSSPAPFAAYLRLPGKAVVSNSPERFVSVSVEPDGALRARTQPIKGTAPRGSTSAQDAALATALRASDKDRAENLMIVDLMRNDLARVCEPGSVVTPELFAVETFANVHHLVSTVTGRIADGRTAVDLLRAAFPPGSITGAPKVQAMKVIAGLEAPRGPFFGSMFQLGFDGSLDSSVLIRTAACVEEPGGWRVEVRAGAGIVADSQPMAERIETEVKVSALAAALGAGLERDK